MSLKLFPLGIVNPTSKQPSGAVIFFHGSGNNTNEFNIEETRNNQLLITNI
ncbi:hypothetical protein B7P43_G15873 [Cryptotermes secundus]|uniref:Uncharacterized protein n=1 Tax=Cryptotermes secundus TaxID=105785 RepID=A0A2J7R6T2_9NEOP|nr:hypothetical protein B7P43_G15873 [Cryptotermes secundus]